jgi:hypothetical protein
VCQIGTSVDAYRAERKKVCLQQGVTWQPQLLLFGDDIFNVEQCLVLMMDVVFECESVIKGVDVCFKAFFTFNLKYPAQAIDSWLFIQQALYGIRTISDKLSPRLRELVSLVGS